MGITTHAKERLQQRNEFVDTFACAKRNAKVAFVSGKCIHEVAKEYPKTAEWMSYKKDKICPVFNCSYFILFSNN